jgi:naphthoate synthase
MLKGACNAVPTAQAGMQQFAGDATLLYYMSEEAQEFHSAQRQKRKPDARRFPWLP